MISAVAILKKYRVISYVHMGALLWKVYRIEIKRKDEEIHLMDVIYDSAFLLSSD